MSNGFPTYASSAKQGELGVNIVSRIVSDTFGWLFKRVHQEHDFGIDGQIELVTDSGAVTAQMLAVQIKCGKTFFREKNKWGYIYRGELKHFNYLANYPIPVIIIICDPESKDAFWVHFQKEKTQLTSAGWTLTVPFENQLREAKTILQSLVPPTRDSLAELEAYWELNKILVGSSIIHYVIEKQDVESLNILGIRSFFDRLRATKELAYECQGKIEISFWGYINDTRELFEIPQVRKYIQILDTALPELFFFARTEQPTDTLRTFALSLTKVHWKNKYSARRTKRMVWFETDKVAEFLARQFPGLNDMTEWLGMSIEENKRITSEVMRCIGLEMPE